MRRVLAFLVAVIGCIALIGGAYTHIGGYGEELTFPEDVMYGDPSVMDGTDLSLKLRCGNHMFWDVEYHFGETDTWETEFTFSQKSIPETTNYEEAPLSVYTHTGWGISGTTFMEIAEGDYAELLKTAVAMTPDGEEREIRLKLKDFVDYAACNFSLHYSSDKYWCDEYVDVLSWMTGGDAGLDSSCYTAFTQLFRFPVQEEQIACIMVEKTSSGGITSLYYDDESMVEATVMNTATDDGLFCVPVYTRGHDASEAIPGEYALGMGIYFIPWKIVENAQIISQSHEIVTLDVEKAENIYPLPENTIVYDIQVVGNSAWLLSLEHGTYYMTKLDLENRAVICRLELMDYDPDAWLARPNVFCRNGLVAVVRGGKLALIQDGAAPSVEFIVPLGDAEPPFRTTNLELGDMQYRDGTLYMAFMSYNDGSMAVVAFDGSGPLYWGDFWDGLHRPNGHSNPQVLTESVLWD